MQFSQIIDWCCIHDVERVFTVSSSCICGISLTVEDSAYLALLHFVKYTGLNEVLKQNPV